MRSPFVISSHRSGSTSEAGTIATVTSLWPMISQMTKNRPIESAQRRSVATLTRFVGGRRARLFPEIRAVIASMPLDLPRHVRRRPQLALRPLEALVHSHREADDEHHERVVEVEPHGRPREGLEELACVGENP